MADINEAPSLPETSRCADERTTLTEMLDYYRAVMLRKVWGLSDQQLDTATPPSDLTLGGLLFHLALVEDSWFDYQFLGNDAIAPWADIPWDDDHDWEFHHANEQTGRELIEQFQVSVARCQAIIADAASLDQESARNREADGKPWNLRWIMVHMIEEYARHCGHADFIRQSIDGSVDD